MIRHQTFNSIKRNHYEAVFYVGKKWDFHFHKNIELIYIIDGELDCIVNNNDYHLSSGEFAMFLPYDIHCILPKPDTQFWILVFSEDNVRSFSKLIAGKRGTNVKINCDKLLNDYLLKNLVYNPAPTSLSLKASLYAICDEYLKSVTLIEKNEKEASLIPRIADYILNNHTINITLSDIARECGYDYNYMSRYFKKTFNMSFKDFLNIHRLETALSLLEETTKSIAEIAMDSGFQSVRSFNCFFKNQIGISPTKYRNTSRK